MGVQMEQMEMEIKQMEELSEMAVEASPWGDDEYDQLLEGEGRINSDGNLVDGDVKSHQLVEVVDCNFEKGFGRGERKQVVRFSEDGQRSLLKGDGIQFLYQLRMQAQRMRMKVEMEKMRLQQEEQYIVSMRGTAVPESRDESSKYFHQESVFETFKTFSATEDDDEIKAKVDCGKRESCLLEDRLAAIQNEAIAAVQAATESVTGIKQIQCTLSRTKQQ